MPDVTGSNWTGSRVGVHPTQMYCTLRAQATRGPMGYNWEWFSADSQADFSGPIFRPELNYRLVALRGKHGNAKQRSRFSFAMFSPQSTHRCESTNFRFWNKIRADWELRNIIRVLVVIECRCYMTLYITRISNQELYSHSLPGKAPSDQIARHDVEST